MDCGSSAYETERGVLQPLGFLPRLSGDGVHSGYSLRQTIINDNGYSRGTADHVHYRFIKNYSII